MSEKTSQVESVSASVERHVALSDTFTNQRPMTEDEAANRFGLSVKTLQAWRYLGKGPKFVRFGRAVRYLPSDVDAFIRASSVDTCREEKQVRR
jgi:predicted DNA-binding transcriptional regulator AlpA